MPGLDCGDNSCIFAERITGMRTNGGCRCLRELPADRQRDIRRLFINLRAEIQQQRERIAELEEQLRRGR